MASPSVVEDLPGSGRQRLAAPKVELATGGLFVSLLLALRHTRGVPQIRSSVMRCPESDPSICGSGLLQWWGARAVLPGKGQLGTQRLPRPPARSRSSDMRLQVATSVSLFWGERAAAASQPEALEDGAGPEEAEGPTPAWLLCALAGEALHELCGPVVADRCGRLLGKDGARGSGGHRGCSAHVFAPARAHGKRWGGRPGARA